MRTYMADFETTPDPDDCRVWLWCMVDLANLDNRYYGTDIKSFFDHIMKEESKIFFHNLKFDGQFILWYALSVLGMKAEDSRKGWTVDTLISDNGVFYKIELIFSNKRRKKAVIWDSLKKLNFPVREIAKAYKLDVSKGDIDHTIKRPPWYQPTQEEIDYVTRDCLVVAKALNIQIEQGLKKMTQSSDALAFCKQLVTKRTWDHYFPVLSVPVDDSIRRSYRGGAVMVHPLREGLEVGAGHSFDKNSMYPWAMCKTLPCGMPLWYDGEYTLDEEYPLYIQFISCEFRVKPGFLPTIQLKNNMNYLQTQYIAESVEQTQLVLTSVDLKLFFDHYAVYNLRWEGGWKFQAVDGLFQPYVDHWYKVKAESTGAMRSIAKLMLNSLYGKLATRTHIRSKVPYLGEDNIVHYKLTEEETKAPVYTAAASFITSYARESVIRSAQALGGTRKDSAFCYMDTDSIHCIGISVEEAGKILEIHPTKLGAWKHEYSFDRAKYLRQKCYIEEIAYHEGTLAYEKYIQRMTALSPEEQQKAGFELGKPAYYEYIKKCAGMTDTIKERVKWGEFDFDYSIDGLKLKPTYVPGGVVLTPVPFTIKRG